jgi:hypothetical protein
MFSRKYPDSAVPCKAMIHIIVTKLRSTGSVMDKKKAERKRHVLTEEKLYDSTGSKPEKVVTSFGSSVWLYVAFCRQIAKQEFGTAGGFRNLYSMDFLTPRHGSLSVVT